MVEKPMLDLRRHVTKCHLSETNQMKDKNKIVWYSIFQMYFSLT